MKSPYEVEESASSPAANTTRKKSMGLVSVILGLTAVSMAYRLINEFDLETTSVLYIGIPAIFALLLTRAPRATSAMGFIMKSITLLLLLIAILLIEGALCILISAPLFYLVGFIIGLCVDRSRKKGNDGKLHLHLGIFFALMSLEGVSKLTSFPRQESITITKIFSGDLEESKKLLLAGPSFEKETLPLFFKLGFPQPQKVESMKDLWQIKFPGMYREDTYLTVRETWITPTEVVYKKKGDSTKMGEWLDWSKVDWRLQPLAGGETEVTMTLYYKRKLDPAWYFGPIQRYGVRKAGEYFFTSVF